MTRPASLLAVFAHPDDEAFSSGGTLAHYAALGVPVSLVCATRGEAGKVTNPALGEAAHLGLHGVGKMREQELKNACAALGIREPVFLNYRDSGRNERLRLDDPQALVNADLNRLESEIRAVIRELKPTVMLTFDPHGGYGHPDHLVIHRAALGAFLQSGSDLGAEAPQRLFFTAVPLESIRAQAGANTPMGGLDPSVYGVSAGTVAVSLDVSAQAGKKRAAIEAHASQVGENSFLARYPQEALQAMLSRENFSVGGTRSPIPSFPLRGFFDGLPGLAEGSPL
ncbi:MAG TPA: PIG-L deacetylase family protein [Deinococcales bacterium]|nr:PIG-L deacetylase family protein [Deinococcales bacterium]